MGREIYLVRHCETDVNKARQLQGLINSPLNEEGQRQAEELFARYRNVGFKAIFTSSLQRTLQSVQGFIDRGIPYFSLKELDDMNWGTLHGRPGNAEEVRVITDQWLVGSLNVTMPEGESPAQMAVRLEQGLSRILEVERERILVCTHSMCVRIILSLLLKKPLVEMIGYNSENAAAHILREVDGEWLEVS